MLPLLLPWITIALVIVASVLIFRKKWRVGMLFFVLAMAVNWWGECFPFRLWPLHETISPCNIRVLTFNIKSTNKNIGEKINKLTELVGKNVPEIIYIAEISKSVKPLLDSLLIKDYPYLICNDSHVFYSKYLLLGSTTLGLNEIEGKNVLKCLAVRGTDTITLYGCHLASNNYNEGLEYITPDSIKSYGTFMQYLNDIKLAYQKRINVARAITCDASKLKSPIIVFGDMNDVGGSKPIRLIQSIGLKDAWWEGGIGYGATIHKPLPYRIDHVLYSNHFELNNIKLLSSEGVSDHDAIFAEFSY